uniref:Uncharacterized protein n=1 Tax=Strombidium rassoulzadegani TaxID=1082188 RepID=A0A7S3CU06_9SPIT|mmetsp:Transcript_9048/g.15296  ORF Transcript_9048/g.15296 Transcript_9048/m.15296 type:complete len:131 (+) Transcript_9048:816-1208(+)
MKILVDLNIKHKITMIMVTHDQGLKNFANRIVKMSDGKVLKITTVDPTIRGKMIEDLDNKVLAHIEGSKDAQKISIREGIYDASVKRDIENKPKIPTNFSALKDINTSKTSVRRPKDYPVLGERFTKQKI